MSAEAMGHAFRTSPYSGPTFTIHLTIADTVNDAYENRCWLTVSSIMGKSRTSHSSVVRALRQMVADGYLEVVTPGGGRGRPTEYRYLLGKGAGETLFGTEKGVTETVKGVTEASRSSSKPKEPKRAPTAQTAQRSEVDTFEEFWKVYPHRRNAPRWRKGEALKAWTKSGASAYPALTIGAASAYAASRDVRRGFIMRPDRWLLTEPWLAVEAEAGSEFGDDGIVDGAPWLE